MNFNKINNLAAKGDEEFTFAVAPVERRISLRRSSLFGLENSRNSKSIHQRCPSHSFSKMHLI